jgi:hypothetical protein
MAALPATWDSLHGRDSADDLSTHMPLERYVDKTNGQRKELSIDLFQYLNHTNTPIRTKTINEVAVEAHKRAYKVFDHWAMLHAILLEHENTIRTRWIKKTHEQRKRVLLAAWPEMPELHRPDMQAITKESVEQRRKGTKFREAFWFPYINLEDLLKAKNLLLFFQSRGHNLPEVFAHHDLMATCLGRRSTAIQPLYVDGYTTFFSGAKVPEGYGTMAAWQEVPFGFTDDDAFELMWSGIGWQPGDGLVILEIQETVLQFLVKCAELILHDLLPLKTPPIPVRLFSPEEAFPDASRSPPITVPIPSDSSWASVAATTAEAPYRVPVQFDFQHLQHLVDARRAEAEDYIWTLREDPGFFQDVVNDHGQHHHEALTNKNGKHHPEYDTPKYWTRMFRYVSQHAYQRLALWDAVQSSLNRLLKIRQKYPDYGIRIAPLPWDHAEELAHFQYLIKSLRPILISDFHGIMASPPIRNYYLREALPELPQGITLPQGVTAILTRRADDTPGDGFIGYFLWLLEMYANPDQLELVGIYNVLDELERITRNARALGGPSDNLISPFMAAAISELAVIAEIQRQLDWHQPRILTNWVSDHDLKATYTERTVLMSKFERVEADFYDVGWPLMEMKYPVDKPRTAVTVDKMRKAEDALDTFWAAVDEFYRKKDGKPLHELFVDQLTPHELYRTPEWVEPPSPPPEPTVEKVDVFSDPFPTTFGESSARVEVEAPAREKLKTRGVPSKTSDRYSQSEDDVNISLPNEAPTPQDSAVAPEPVSKLPPFGADWQESETIKVSKRAYEMFTTIFHTENRVSLPGEVPWSEFVHGMWSAGFSIEKQLGSAWLFTPSDQAQKSISFHEPHPIKKIPIRIARRLAWRLHRYYGWTARTFVLKR